MLGFIHQLTFWQWVGIILVIGMVLCFARFLIAVGVFLVVAIGALASLILVGLWHKYQKLRKPK